MVLIIIKVVLKRNCLRLPDHTGIAVSSPGDFLSEQGFLSQKVRKNVLVTYELQRPRVHPYSVASNLCTWIYTPQQGVTPRAETLVVFSQHLLFQNHLVLPTVAEIRGLDPGQQFICDGSVALTPQGDELVPLLNGSVVCISTPAAAH
jgi:hypothetical protein